MLNFSIISIDAVEGVEGVVDTNRTTIYAARAISCSFSFEIFLFSLALSFISITHLVLALSFFLSILIQSDRSL
jgi:hypothetical protein